MIELNLLPDVKLEYIKAQRSRQTVLTISIIVTIVAVTILVLLLLANSLQRKHINDLSRDITKESSKLQGQTDIDRILTVQNQLESLTDLHNGKPAASRLADYLNQLTPSQVSISNFTIDFTTQVATISGSADALSSVNKYVDTLKFTTYTSDSVTKATPAFNNVVLSNFGVSSASGPGGGTSYTITLAYDKSIFDITQNIKLSVPNTTTTRSAINQPTALFQDVPANKEGQ